MPGKGSRAEIASRRRPRGLLGRTLGAVWRHPLLAGIALAATGWFVGGERRRRLPRTRGVAR